MTGVDEKPSAFDCRQREREEAKAKLNFGWKILKKEREKVF